MQKLNKNNIKPVETASEQPEVSAPKQSNNNPCDCSKCPYSSNCNYREKFQRLPRECGGLGLCPNLKKPKPEITSHNSVSEKEATAPEQSDSAPETNPKHLYYFTDEDGKKFFESFETPDDAYWIAKELANNYDITIFVNTIDKEIVDFACPDDLPF